jgi:hypothetical protein
LAFVFSSGCKHEYPQHPAVVLTAWNYDGQTPPAQIPPYKVVKNTAGTEVVEVEFNWDDMTIGGVPLMHFAEKADAKHWRINVFDTDNGNRFPGGGTDAFSSIQNKTMKLTGLPLETFLRADLDFKKGDSADAEAQSFAFIVLFKKGTPITQPGM